METVEFYAQVYDSKSIHSLRMIAKPAFITDKNIHLFKAGPKAWHNIFIFILMPVTFVLLLWYIASNFSKGKEIVIPLRNIKKVELEHPKYTLINRIKITEKNGNEHYFIPLATKYQILNRKNFAEKMHHAIKMLLLKDLYGKT